MLRIAPYTFLLTVLVTSLIPSFAFADAAPTPESGLGYGDAVILGGVEGVTEYLPVSSTGHLILAEHLLGLDDTPAEKAAVDAYCIAIQIGAIAAVALLYWNDIQLMILGLMGKSREGFRLGLNLVIAFIPAAILGFLLGGWIEAHLFGPWPVAIALALGAPLMLGVEAWRKKRLAKLGNQPEIQLHELSPAKAALVGILQCVAMWPGTSRSMMTITGGYIVGLTPEKSARFSFLLGLITLTAATGYTILKHGREMAACLSAGPVLVGVIVAAVTAALSVKWLVGFLSRRGLSLFAYYRLVISTVIILSLAC
jgi:undecaprenyl-diphosphatase